MRKHICHFFLRLFGWKAGEPPIPGPKGIILGVPHTSAWDFIISYLYYYSVGGKAFVMVKNRQIVIDGITDGIVTFLRVVNAPAPSTLAASKISVEIF